MKGWLKLLVLGAIPILAVTMVANQALAADKGSQLIYQHNMVPMHKSFISIANAHDARAVTVLTQYYNDEMEQVLWYLRILPPNGNVLVDPFDHMIPGDEAETNTGAYLMANNEAATDHFVIVVTAVAADLPADADAEPEIELNAGSQANILFPAFLAKGMDDVGNIDEGGNNYPTDGEGVDRSPPDFADDDTDEETDTSSTNVGDLNRGNFRPVSFNHLTGHFTEALIGNPAGGSDQTASWGGTPTVRPAMGTNVVAGDDGDYVKLDGTAAVGMLAEENAGGVAMDSTNTDAREGYSTGSDIEAQEGTATNRGINDGALVLPALHGVSDMSQHIMLILSAADNYGDPGKYGLVAAKTGFSVSLMDSSGGVLADPAAADKPVFGGPTDPETPPSTRILVDGIRVWTDTSDCNLDDEGMISDENMIMGPWSLTHLTSIVPAAMAGTDDFAGLDAGAMYPTVNRSPGWIKFKRMALKCTMDFGDGDPVGDPTENPDGVPVEDERTYDTGTLYIEQEDATRTFVTVGRAIVKVLTPKATFGASWTLKSPPSPAGN